MSASGVKRYLARSLSYWSHKTLESNKSDFCLPHASLRQPLSQPLPTNGNGSAKRWQPQTPAMAAGLTDHVWSLREVLLFRVPPWPQPAGV
jgi:hypothetical protein